MIWYLIILMNGGYGAAASVTPMPNQQACSFMLKNIKQMATNKLQQTSARCVGVRK